LKLIQKCYICKVQEQYSVYLIVELFLIVTFRFEQTHQFASFLFKLIINLLFMIILLTCY